jgi:hypothetical protein
VIVERLTRELEARGIPFRIDGAAIRVAPSGASGFEVSLAERPDGCAVHYGGWHEWFADPEEAADCFRCGLTPGVRLRVKRRGGVPVRWTLEVRDPGGPWKKTGVVGLVFSPFWRPADEVILQNGAEG